MPRKRMRECSSLWSCCGTTRPAAWWCSIVACVVAAASSVELMVEVGRLNKAFFSFSSKSQKKSRTANLDLVANEDKEAAAKPAKLLVSSSSSSSSSRYPTDSLNLTLSTRSSRQRLASTGSQKKSSGYVTSSDRKSSRKKRARSAGPNINIVNSNTDQVEETLGNMLNASLNH